MKKILVIFLCVGVLSAVAVYFVLPKKKGLLVESVLPQGVQLYMHFDNVSENVDQISRGPFWQEVSRIDYDTLVSQNVLSPVQAITIQGIHSKLNDPQVQMILKKLFGKEFALAVYPLNVSLNQLNDMSVLNTPTFLDDALSNFIIVSRISADMQLVEFFSGLLGDLGKNAKKETLNYKDFTIHTIIFNPVQFKLSYVRIKDLLVVTLGERAAQKIIDVHLGEKPALAKEKKFSETQKYFVDDSEVAVYWDMAQFVSFIKEQAEVVTDFIMRTQTNERISQADVATQIDEMLSSVYGFESFFISGRLDAITEFKFNMVMDLNKISPSMVQYYKCDPVENKTLQFVPKDALGYQWNGCVDFNFYWDQLLAEIDKTQKTEEQAESVANQIIAFESLLGLSLARDIFPAFGDEFGGILQDIYTGGMFPVPAFMVFVEVKDKDKINSLFSLLEQNPMVIRQNETYQGVSINYFSSPIGGEDLQPSYGYIEDYLVIAVNRKIFRAALDAKKSSAMSLLSDPGFKKINQGLSGKNMSVFFGRTGVFSAKLIDLIRWGNSWVSAQQKQRQALKAGSQQRLDIVLRDIQQLEESISSLQSETAEVATHVQEYKTQGLSTDASEEELVNLNDMIEKKQQDLAATKEEQAKLENLIGNYENDGLSVQQREVFLEKLLYPLITGLGSIEILGGRTTVDNGVFESNILMKINY